MGSHYTEHLERALAETTKIHTELVQKLELTIAELEKCQVALFEAEDKFHVLSFYINDAQALECARSRVDWMYEAGNSVVQTLKSIEKDEYIEQVSR
jgi:hypothetical protein